MNRRTITRALIAGAAVLLAAGGASAAEPMSADEQRLYMLFERHLNTLSWIIAVVGAVFVALQFWFQYQEGKRERAQRSHVDQLNKRTDDLMHRTAELIASMNGMVSLATQGQETVKSLQTELQQMKEQFKQAQEEAAARERERLAAEVDLRAELTSFLGRYNRFHMHPQHLRDAEERIRKLQLDHQVRNDKLPPEALIVRGLFHTLIRSNNQVGNDEFNEALARPDFPAHLRQKVLLNRGINHANLQKYAAALEDFEELEKLDPTNLLYRFYRLDTQLMLARQAPGGSADLTKLAGELETLARGLEGEVFCEPVKPRELRIRVLRSLGSALLGAGRPDDALVWLRDRTLDNDGSALYLRLRALEAEGVGSLPPDDVAACRARAEAEQRRAAEPRSRLLRGMIVGQCLAWLGDPQLARHKQDLRDVVTAIQAEQGGDVSIFSPLSQRNEPIDVILKQIESLQPAPAAAASV